MEKKPAKGALCHCRTPRGTVKIGRFVEVHTTHTGVWWEFKPLKGGGGENWRSRPASVTLAL